MFSSLSICRCWKNFSSSLIRLFSTALSKGKRSFNELLLNFLSDWLLKEASLLPWLSTCEYSADGVWYWSMTVSFWEWLKFCVELFNFLDDALFVLPIWKLSYDSLSNLVVGKPVEGSLGAITHECLKLATECLDIMWKTDFLFTWYFTLILNYNKQNLYDKWCLEFPTETYFQFLSYLDAYLLGKN